MDPGHIAALTFLFSTVLGLCAQVYKLRDRAKRWRHGELPREDIYAGLLPERECWSFAAFLLFALSGLTRSYTDLVLIVSRLPAIALATAILYLLAQHGAPRAPRLFRLALAGNGALVLLLAVTVSGGNIGSVLLTTTVDGALGVVCAGLFVGKINQALTMYRMRRSGGVSHLREVGLLMKDATGLWYAVTVGSELLVVGLTHLCAIAGSGAIIAVKFLLERGPDSGTGRAERDRTDI